MGCSPSRQGRCPPSPTLIRRTSSGDAPWARRCSSTPGHRPSDDELRSNTYFPPSLPSENVECGYPVRRTRSSVTVLGEDGEETTASHSGVVLTSLSRRVVDRREDKPLTEEVECPVCLDTISVNDSAMRCAGEHAREHYFHAECLAEWSQTQRTQRAQPTCPVCRGYVSFPPALSLSFPAPIAHLSFNRIALTLRSHVAMTRGIFFFTQIHSSAPRATAAVLGPPCGGRDVGRGVQTLPHRTAQRRWTAVWVVGCDHFL